MQSITITGTKLTPSIIIDAKKGLIEIEGCSVTDSVTEFYKPVFELIDKYIVAPADETVVNIKLEYLTIQSSKCILEVFKKLELLHKKGNSKVIVNWYHAADDMLEAGKNYQLIIKLPFKLLEF